MGFRSMQAFDLVSRAYSEGTIIMQVSEGFQITWIPTKLYSVELCSRRISTLFGVSHYCDICMYKSHRP